MSQVVSRVKNEVSTTQINQSIANPDSSNFKQHKVFLPYEWKIGEHTLRNIKRHITKLLPEQEGVTLVFTGSKIGTKFNIKDKTSKEYQHDLTDSAVCSDAQCNEEYNDEKGGRLIERVHAHSGKDVNSHVFKRSTETDHPTVTIDDFRVLKTVYLQKKLRRKWSKALFIKQNKPALNKQETFTPLKLFNWLHFS